MFFDDLKDLRNIIVDCFKATTEQNVKLKREFQQERLLFLHAKESIEEDRLKLREQLAILTKQLANERELNARITAEENVNQMCQKAYYSLELQKQQILLEDAQKLQCKQESTVDEIKSEYDIQIMQLKFQIESEKRQAAKVKDTLEVKVVNLSAKLK